MGALTRLGENVIRIDTQGEAAALYQLVGRYYLPWEGVEQPAGEPLSIEVLYDRTRLEVDDIVNAAVTVSNNTSEAMGMVVVNLGVPPGFDVVSADLSRYVDQGTFARFDVTGRQVIVYLQNLDAAEEVKFVYGMRARFPIRAQTPESRVYVYYEPDQQAVAEPVEIEVE